MSNNRNKMVTIGGIVVAVILLGVCIFGVVGFIYRDSLLAMLGLAPRQGVAQMLPAETQFYMVTNPNIQNLPGYQNIKELYLDNPDIQALLDQVEEEAEIDITFEGDIQPWLGGEVALAVLDFASVMEGPDNDEIPSLVMAAETTDVEASNNFIAKILAEAEENDEPFTNEEYEGITLHLQENEFNGETAYLTTFNDFVVLATDEDLVKEMIDRSLGNNDEPALVDNASFQKTTNQLPAEGLVTMYMTFSGLFDQILADSMIEFPQSKCKISKPLRHLA